MRPIDPAKRYLLPLALEVLDMNTAKASSPSTETSVNRNTACGVGLRDAATDTIAFD